MKNVHALRTQLAREGLAQQPLSGLCWREGRGRRDAAPGCGGACHSDDATICFHLLRDLLRMQKEPIRIRAPDHLEDLRGCIVKAREGPNPSVVNQSVDRLSEIGADLVQGVFSLLLV